MIVLWLAAGVLGKAQEAPPVEQPGGQQLGGGSISHAEANRIYEAQRDAERAAKDRLIEALEPERSTKPKKVKTRPVTLGEQSPSPAFKALPDIPVPALADVVPSDLAANIAEVVSLQAELARIELLREQEAARLAEEEAIAMVILMLEAA